MFVIGRASPSIDKVHTKNSQMHESVLLKIAVFFLFFKEIIKGGLVFLKKYTLWMLVMHIKGSQWSGS